MNDIATQKPIIKRTVWHDKRLCKSTDVFLKTAKFKGIIIAIVVEKWLLSVQFIQRFFCMIEHKQRICNHVYEKYWKTY